MRTGEDSGEKPARDWAKTLDLGRTTVTKNYVDRFEEAMRADAREQIEALHRIGKAVDFDLFDWADVAN